MAANYAVIDIEATGGTQKVDRIIEIAIIHIDDGEITDSYSTLINPRISIPSFISGLTGISNEMVKDAPEFHEIAKKVVQMTSGRSLVAHNVSFDYRILREEFNRLGFEFKSDTLCTARLSKHYFPNIEKYSLPEVAKSLNIRLPDHHRAMDDANATAKIMQRILSKSEANGDDTLRNMSIYKRRSKLPMHINEEDILDLPNVCGIYYMNDKDGEPLYIGKSLKIRSRIRSHFSSQSKKWDKMHQLVYSFSYTKTGSELMAEIMESIEIRKHKPLLNKAKRRSKFNKALVATKSDDGFNMLAIKTRGRVKQDEHVIQWFSTKNSAKAYISGLVDQYALCSCLCNLRARSKDCTIFKLGQCSGASVGLEHPADYNERFEEAVINSKFLFEHDLVILDKGRNKEERSVFLVTDQCVSHIGFLPANTNWEVKNSYIDKLTKIKYLPEIDRTIFRYCYLNKYIERIAVH